MESNFILEPFKKICGEDNVSTCESHLIGHGRDCSTPSLLEIREGHAHHPAEVVVWPTSTEQVSSLLKIANEHEIPLLPYGAGSGVCGGAVPLKGGIVLDLQKMDRVLSIDPQTLTVTAEAGILGSVLERKLNEAGFTLGHFPSSIDSATLGGYLACRSAGQLSTKYGKIEDMVEEFTVCLADGRVLNLRASSPFNLQELFMGSEGTLGVITQAKLKIHPQPEIQKYGAFHFSDLSKGLNAIRHFMQKGYRPAVVRLYDPLDSLFFLKHHDEASLEKKTGFLKSAQKFLMSRSLKILFLQSTLLNRLIDLSLSKSLMILGFEGPAWKVNHEFQEVFKICEQEKGVSLGEAVGLQWLERRYNVAFKMGPLMQQNCFADTMEVATSWARLEELYQALRKAIAPHALVMAHFSHAYAEGCSIYFTFATYARGEEKSLQLHRKIWDCALQACHEHGGTISHHHGVGFLKAKAFVQELGPLHDWLKKVKKNLDPQGILNPGKLGL